MASDNRNKLARTMGQLAEAGFRPVWSREHGYPGTIPEDIGEYIDSNSYRFDELIGPLSSIFWLAGLDELVDAINDPAIALEDEVRLIPTNVGVRWILEHLFEEDKLPASMYDRYFFGYNQPPVVVMPVRPDPIPLQKTLPHLRPSARIFLLSSTLCHASTIGHPYLIYLTSKGPVKQMVHVLAKNLGPKDITINAVAPGPTDTELSTPGKPEPVLNAMKNLSPWGRLGTPEDIVETSVFSNFPASGWVSG
ncbi:hypothetical protein CBS147332_5564 [Penicillium roqueforti]|nr:hypothetical protein CBS147332_5564 [Penicillium roqueforti]KAI3107877.1 hypothetical protein CBS147331_5978 [Penicillium roqueforti]